MAHANTQNFDKRLEKILRKHQKMARGYVPTLTEDGLIVATPRRRVRLPWRAGLFLLVVLMGFKAILLSSIGTTAYAERVAGLQAGTQIERAGAWVMTADPVTVWLSEQIIQFKP